MARQKKTGKKGTRNPEPGTRKSEPPPPPPRARSRASAAFGPLAPGAPRPRPDLPEVRLHQLRRQPLGGLVGDPHTAPPRLHPPPPRLPQLRPRHLHPRAGRRLVTTETQRPSLRSCGIADPRTAPLPCRADWRRLSVMAMQRREHAAGAPTRLRKPSGLVGMIDPRPKRCNSCDRREGRPATWARSR